MRTLAQKELTSRLELFLHDWESYKEELFKTAMGGQTYYKNKNMFLKDPEPYKHNHLRQEIHFFHSNEFVDLEISPAFQIFKPLDIKYWFNTMPESKKSIMEYARALNYRISASMYLNVGL